MGNGGECTSLFLFRGKVMENAPLFEDGAGHTRLGLENIGPFIPTKNNHLVLRAKLQPSVEKNSYMG